MVGVFVQINTDSPKARSNPVGYVPCGDGCWEWVGCSSVGYGHMYDPAKKRMVLAHRWVYEREHGPIPEGHDCHHVCANRGCVNPDHLEIVTPTEHYNHDTAMQGGALKRAKVNRTKTHCPQGHPYSGANLFVYRGWRNCRKCKDRARRASRARRQERLFSRATP